MEQFEAVRWTSSTRRAATVPCTLAAAGGNTNTLCWLLEMGADPDARASDGTTPFYAACEQGHVAVLHILHNLHGADMTAVDQDGTSPALIAAANGWCDVLQMLNESGVDLQATGHIYEGGFTAFIRPCGGMSHRLQPRAIVNSMQLWHTWS